MFHPWPTIPRAVRRNDGLIVYFRPNAYCWIPEKVFGGRKDYLTVIDWITAKVADFKELDA